VESPAYEEEEMKIIDAVIQERENMEKFVQKLRYSIDHVDQVVRGKVGEMDVLYAALGGGFASIRARDEEDASRISHELSEALEVPFRKSWNENMGEFEWVGTDKAGFRWYVSYSPDSSCTIEKETESLTLTKYKLVGCD
jgi:hypothetical protein